MFKLSKMHQKNKTLTTVWVLYFSYEVILSLIPEFQKLISPIGTIIQLLLLLVISYYTYMATISYNHPMHSKNIYWHQNHRISPFIIGLSLWLIELVYSFGIHQLIPHLKTSSNQNYILELMHQNNATIVLIVVSSIVIAPLIEESIFRGIILGCHFNNRFEHITKMTLSIILFIAIHVVNDINRPINISFLINTGAYLILAIGLTINFDKTHNLKNNVIIHGTYNAISIIFTFI